MTGLTRLGGSSAAILLLTSTTALADLTARQVWDDMSAYLKSFGYEVSATESRDGDTLTVQDLRIGMDFPEASGTMAVTMDRLTLTETGDGAVRVGFPQTTPITLSGKTEGEDSETFDLRLDYTHSNLDLIVSGDAQEMSYDYTADSIGLALAELKIDGKPVPESDAKGAMTLAGVAGSTVMKPGTLREISQMIKADRLDYALSGADPEGEGRGAITGGLTGLAMAGTTTLPASMDPENMAATLDAGFAVTGEFSHTGSKAEFTFTEEGETTTGSSASAGGKLAMQLDGDRLNYSGDSMEAAINVSSAQFPFPVEFRFEGTSFNFLMPIGPDDTPQDFAMALALRGFEMSDAIWTLFDAQGVLPRDPATIAIDMSGKAALDFNIMDPEQMEAQEQREDFPGTLDSFKLNDLTVSAVGADLNGEGSFIFDNSDTTTFDGIPRPMGTLNLTLSGANALMDRLVELGMLPQEQVMGARMMLGMFAVPAEGEDTLKSTIEINAEGHVLANGQRIK